VLRRSQVGKHMGLWERASLWRESCNDELSQKQHSKRLKGHWRQFWAGGGKEGKDIERTPWKKPFNLSRFASSSQCIWTSCKRKQIYWRFLVIRPEPFTVHKWYSQKKGKGGVGKSKARQYESYECSRVNFRPRYGTKKGGDTDGRNVSSKTQER